MKDYDLSFHFDENLHEQANSVTDMDLYIHEQKVALNTVQSPVERVKILGTLGIYLRILGELEEALDYLLKALEVIDRHGLDPMLRWTQEIRLAHVYQWQKLFNLSNPMFEKLLSIAKTQDVGPLQDFIWQHAGKNYFDQMAWQKSYDCFAMALKLRELRNAPTDQLESSRESMKTALQRMN